MPRSRSASRAKSTIMMPFFFTMPISRMMPMIPITSRPKPYSQQHQQGACAGRRQGGQDGQRMDRALVQHAEDDVDDDQRRHDQDRLCCDSEAWKAWPCPGKSPDQGGGVQLLHGRFDRRVASPSVTPGARLNDRVIAGNWPWWLIDERRRPWLVDLDQRASGTCCPRRRLHVDLSQVIRPAEAPAAPPAPRGTGWAG